MADATNEAIPPQDLDLLDAQGLEDQTSSPEEIWKELDAQEAAAQAAADKPAADVAGDDGAKPEAAGADGTGSTNDAAAAEAAGNQDEPDADAAPGKAKTDETQDIWATAPPELRAAHVAAQTKLQRLEHAARSDRGRIAALQRQIETPARKPEASRKDAPVTVDAGFLTSEKWKKLKEEWPEVAGPLEDVIGTLEGETTRMKKELSAIGDDRRQTALNEQAELLSGRHPDWQDLLGGTNGPHFEAWLDRQPRHVREAVQRNAQEVVDAEEAADVVGRYKAFVTWQKTQGEDGKPDANQRPSGDNPKPQAQPLSDKRKRQLESSTTTRSRGPAAVAGIPDDREGAWKYFESIGR